MLGPGLGSARLTQLLFFGEHLSVQFWLELYGRALLALADGGQDDKSGRAILLTSRAKALHSSGDTDDSSLQSAAEGASDEPAQTAGLHVQRSPPTAGNCTEQQTGEFAKQLVPDYRWHSSPVEGFRRLE